MRLLTGRDRHPMFARSLAAVLFMAALLPVLAGPVSANPADAPLVERLASPDLGIRRRAAEEVAKLSLEEKRAYLPQLLILINDPDSYASDVARRATCVMGSSAQEAFPVLIQAFAAEPVVQRRYASCLRNFGGVLVMPSVMQALDDERYLIRKGALLTLEILGHEAEPALPRLRALLAAPILKLDVSETGEAPRVEVVDMTEPVRAAIESIEARPTLEERLLSEDESIQHSAVNIVKGLSQEGRVRYLDTLIGLLGDDDSTIRWNAGAALCDFGARAEHAIPALIQAYATVDGEEALQHVNCVRQFGTLALPYLIDALNDGNTFSLIESISLLGAMGPDAASALPALREFATRRQTAWHANEAIAKITAPPTLQERVESTNGIIWQSALREVGSLPPAERAPYVPYYVDYLRRNQGINQFPAVARMLCDTGQPAEAAIPIVIRRFVETSNRWYVDCVAEFGLHAVPALIDALSDPKFMIRQRAIEALEQIGSPARAALPALRDLSQQYSLRLDVSAYAAAPRLETVTLAPAAESAIAAISANTDTDETTR